MVSLAIAPDAAGPTASQSALDQRRKSLSAGWAWQAASSQGAGLCDAAGERGAHAVSMPPVSPKVVAMALVLVFEISANTVRRYQKQRRQSGR